MGRGGRWLHAYIHHGFYDLNRPHVQLSQYNRSERNVVWFHELLFLCVFSSVQRRLYVEKICEGLRREVVAATEPGNSTSDRTGSTPIAQRPARNTSTPTSSPRRPTLPIPASPLSCTRTTCRDSRGGRRICTPPCSRSAVSVFTTLCAFSLRGEQSRNAILCSSSSSLTSVLGVCAGAILSRKNTLPVQARSADVNQPLLLRVTTRLLLHL